MEFSTHGNAHSCILDEIVVDTKLHHYAPDQLDYLLSNGKSISTPPYYVPVYYSKLTLDDQVTDKFNKLIRITYDRSNVNDIVYVFVGKFHIDEQDLSVSIIRSKLKSMSAFYRFFIDRFKITNPNVLDISWNDLVYNDNDVLLQKLSDFTLIPKDNFNLENLLNWRSKTLQGIENVKYMIGDSHGIQ
jgi:hypothetical protein